MTAGTEVKQDAEAKRARLAETWAMRDDALAAGLETWDAERIAGRGAQNPRRRGVLILAYVGHLT